MQQGAQARGRWRHWTGRILPVLAVALLALGPAHAKDKKKKTKDAAQPEQILPSSNTPASDKDPPKADVREPASSSKRVSIDKVVDQVQKKYKVRVLSHSEKEKDGRAIYELKLLSDDGHVRYLKVDAETGKEI